MKMYGCVCPQLFPIGHHYHLSVVIAVTGLVVIASVIVMSECPQNVFETKNQQNSLCCRRSYRRS